MDKNDVLDKARHEGNDEGMKHAKNKGRAWGVAAFTAVYVIISIFNLITDKPNDIENLFYTAYISAESFPEFLFTKKKIFLFTAVFGAVVTVVGLINYMTGKM